MKKIFTLICLFVSLFAFGQEPTLTVGSQRSMTSLKNPEAITFRVGTNNYVLFKKFQMADGMMLHLEGFSDPTDTYLCSVDIPTPHAVNEIAIYEGFIALNDKMVLFRSVFKKDDKKCVLYAHELDEKGAIKDAAGVEITSIVAEKAMNSGNFIIKASADGKSFVVLNEYPFVKEAKEKFAVTVFDNKLNQVWAKEIELQYDSRRGPVNDPFVSNSGVAYIIKKVEGPKNADFYTTYQIADKGAKVKENVLEFEAPKKLVNYGYAIDEMTNDLSIAGYYTEDGKVSISFGGTNFKGSFLTRISGTTGEITVHTTSAFEKVKSTLVVSNVFNLKGNTILIGEDKYENNVATEQKDAMGFPVYNTEYYAARIEVAVFDGAGKNTSNGVIAKENKSVEDGGYSNSLAATLIGEQVMIVYNDYQYNQDGSDHKIIGPGLAGIKIPVIQFIGADGAMGKKFAMIDTKVGGKKSTINLCPQIFVPVSDKEIFFLGKDYTKTTYPIRLKLP